jgi:hypothetical protein
MEKQGNDVEMTLEARLMDRVEDVLNKYETLRP